MTTYTEGSVLSTRDGHAISYIPVLDKAGAVVLYDIFIDGEWHGSRRLLNHAREYVKWLHPQTN